MTKIRIQTTVHLPDLREFIELPVNRWMKPDQHSETQPNTRQPAVCQPVWIMQSTQ